MKQAWHRKRDIKAFTFLCTVTIAAIGLAGCGGGNPSTTTQHTTPPPSSTLPLMDFPAGKYVSDTIYSDQFRLAYTVTNDGVISVGIKDKTAGWVAIAIGSPHGHSDIWIGYVSAGQVTFLDSHDASESGAHPLDTGNGGTNDLTNITGSETSGVTTIEFKRKLDTGDKYDIPLVTGSNVITWAIGPSDDINTEHSVVGLATFEIPVLPTH